MKKNEFIKSKTLSLTTIMVAYFKKINWVYAYIAFIHWYVSFFTDRFIFDYHWLDAYILLIYKGIFLVILFIVWQLVGYAIKEYKNNKNMQIFIRYSLIYFTIMMIFLLLTWPGVWRGDEFGLLLCNRNLVISYWHGSAISYLYIYGMMLFPFPTGVTILQNIIISLIVGYILLQLKQYFGDNKLIYLMYIPFLLFPTIDSNLYLMSTTIYGYLWLLLMIKIFLLGYGKEITNKNIFVLIMIAVLITCFRREGIICLFMLIPLFVFCYKITLKQKIILFIVILMVSSINIISKYNNPEKERYETTNLIAGNLYIYNFMTLDEQSKMYESLDKVMDIKLFFTTGGPEIFIRDFSKEEYVNLKKQMVHMIFKYYKPFFSRRLYYLKSTVIGNFTELLFDGKAEVQYQRLIEMKSFQPISKNLRRTIINFIEIRNSPKFVKIFYNKEILIIFMGLFILISVFLKKKCLLFIWLIVFVQTVLIFFATPIDFFMYYFYLYLCCYVFIAIFVIKAIQIINKKMKLKFIHQ